MREKFRLRRDVVAEDCMPPEPDPTVQTRGQGGGAAGGEGGRAALVSEEEGPSIESGVELHGEPRR